MHKMKRFISGLSATALAITSILSSGVFAANQQVSDGIKLYGNTECAQSGHIVCIDVWAEGKSVEDLYSATHGNYSADSEYADIIVYRDEVMSGEDGAYEVVFDLADRASGVYDAYISCQCSDEIVKESIIHCNPEENKIAIGLLNAAAKDENDPVGEVKKVCRDYKYALGFVSEYVLDDYAASLMVKRITDNELDVENKTVAIEVFEKAVAISAIKSRNITNFFDETDMLVNSESKLYEVAKNSYATKAVGTYVISKMFDKTYYSIEEFDLALEENFVLGVVKYADGWGEVREVLNLYKTEIGISSVSKEQALKVMKKEYRSYTDLKNALGSESSDGGGGGGGGSSGGGGGNSSTKENDGLKYSSEYTDNITVAEKINKNIFNDIDSVSWAIEPIVELAQMGVVSGKEEGLFCPYDVITREEFVKIIMLTFFKDSEVADVSFTDVDNSAWYAEYVKAACGKGIINGIGYNLFGTGMNITREDMAVIAYRTAVAAGKLAAEPALTDFKFNDDALIADYSKNAVYALYNADVINGVTLETFAPKQALTRAEAAKIVYFIHTL